MRTILLILSLWSVCVYAQPSLDLLGHKTYDAEMSDVWGYADGNGNEYALATTRNGISIVDVTTPTMPTELFFHQSSASSWHDVKTWETYAYEVNETSGGLLILDLSNLPTSYAAANWSGGNFQGEPVNFTKAHNIFIDENGIGYIVGANYGVGGVIIVDLATDPTNPIIIGVWNTRYVHDLFVRNDTMWTADIYQGYVSIIDATDKANLTLLNTVPTPSNFTHNVWMSDDGLYLFTTDEVQAAPVGVYDISNVFDVKPIDQYFSTTNSSVIPHNVFVKGNYIYTAYYRDGVTVADISDPTQVTQVASYDTSPSFEGYGFNGCWGIYPYLPSGNILATDIENGLFVLGEATTNINGIYVSPKVFLQGAFISNSSTTLMRDDLRSNNFLPTTEPYSNLANFTPMNGGGETVNATIFPTTGNDAIVDWVYVELRDKDDATNVVATRSALLQRDGDIVDLNGMAAVYFPTVPPDNYYVAIRHRNHLSVMSDDPLILSKTPMAIDFTSTFTKTYGQNAQALLTNGKRAMWAGNTNLFNNLIFQGINNDANDVFFAVLTAPNGSEQANYIYSGYHTEDVDMNGQIIYQGTSNETNTIFFNVLTHPNNSNLFLNYIIQEQLP